MVAPGAAEGRGALPGRWSKPSDLYPTLCELAGLPVPAGLDGASFAGVLKDPATAKTKEAVFHVYPRTPKGLGELLGRAVRTERYRLVEWKKAGAPADTPSWNFTIMSPIRTRRENLAADQPESGRPTAGDPGPAARGQTAVAGTWHNHRPARIRRGETQAGSRRHVRPSRRERRRQTHP